MNVSGFVSFSSIFRWSELELQVWGVGEMLGGGEGMDLILTDIFRSTEKDLTG